MCILSIAVQLGVFWPSRKQTPFLPCQLVHLFQVILVGSAQNKAWPLVHTETQRERGRKGKWHCFPLQLSSPCVNEQACTLLDFPWWVFMESASQQGKCGACPPPYCDRVGDPFNCILCSWPRLGCPDCYQTVWYFCQRPCNVTCQRSQIVTQWRGIF